MFRLGSRGRGLGLESGFEASFGVRRRMERGKGKREEVHAVCDQNVGPILGQNGM
jgi:hypothetical protein